jgi:hypothetical protein
VIGLGRGGLTETVIPTGSAREPTGVFFEDQTVDAVVDAITRFERDADRFDPRAARRNAIRFRQDRFESQLFAYLDAAACTPGIRRAA